MSQLTVQLDKSSEEAIEQLKELLGTKSSGAAIRIALALARHAMPVSKDRTVIVKDRLQDKDLTIVLAS